MSFKWRDSHIPLFLEVYQRYECLWNKKCVGYNKPNARSESYSSMLADLNIPGLTDVDIKLKIKTIRTRYAAELTKVKNSERSGSGADGVYEPRLFWFKQADVFLRSVTTTTKPSCSNLEDLDSTMNYSFYAKATYPSHQLLQDEQPSTDVEDNEAVLPQNNTISPIIITTTTTPTTATHFQSGKRNRRRSSDSFVPDIHGPKKKIKVPYDGKQCLNEFDVFCDSLAIQLKKMPLNRALLCQEKLQRVMTNERLSQLSSASSSYRRPPGRSNSDQQRSAMSSLSIPSEVTDSSEEGELS